MNFFRFRPWSSLVAIILILAPVAMSASAPLNPLENATRNIQVPVLLRKSDRNRVDAMDGSGREELPSGKIFAAVFTGTSGPDTPIVEITSTASDRQSSALGLNTVYSYQVSAVLRLRGEMHVLTATGTERHHGTGNPEAHTQLACERATVDLAKQVQTLLARNKHTGDSAPGTFHSHRHSTVGAPG